ncbi:MAG: carboxypeptidase regulatory-like domain-containing protein [Cyanobacteria bacterium P01_A01_bin.15]
MTLRKLTPFLVFGMLAVAGKTSAHMIETNYALDRLDSSQPEQVLNMQSTFSNGEPLKGAKVNVYSPNNPVTPWTQGVTDSQGRYSFKPDHDLTGNWEVVIRQQGHGDILTIPVNETGMTPELISDRDDTDIHYGGTSHLGWLISLGTLLTLGIWRRLQTH